MDYAQWVRDVAELVGMEPEELEDAYPQLRPLLYDGKLSPSEAADCLRTGM